MMRIDKAQSGGECLHSSSPLLMSTAPWDIYAEQLIHLKYGYPLWVPDPAPGVAPVEIGDVGWINDGEFLPLFNALKGTDEAQPWGAVPIDHTPLDSRGLCIIGPRDKIDQTVLCSRGIRRLKTSGGITAGGYAVAPL